MDLELGIGFNQIFNLNLKPDFYSLQRFQLKSIQIILKSSKHIESDRI